MNILFVSRHIFNPIKGGIERVTDLLTKHFIVNHNVYHLCLINEDFGNYNPIVKTFFFPNEDIYSTENIIYYNNLIEQLKIDILINQYGLAAESKLFLAPHNCKKISVIHNAPLLFYNNYLNYILNSKQGINKILSILFYPFLKHRFKRIRNKHYTYIVNNSNATVLLSQTYKKQFSIFASKNVFAISNPTAQYLNNNFEFTSKKKQVLYVGRLAKTEKTPHYLLYIWQIVQQKICDWELIIVGDGPAKKSMENIAIELHLKNVSFRGFQNPFEYYASASIFAMTSSNEGFPMVLPEAMSHYCVPIIYNSFDAASDIITHNVNGILCKPHDIKSYAKELILLMNNTKQREQLAKEAYRKSLDFNITNIGNQWGNLFNKLI